MAVTFRESFGLTRTGPKKLLGKPGQASRSLPFKARDGFQKYQTLNVANFRAFAFSPTTGWWGRSYLSHSPKQAIDEAMNTCERSGQKCELYALGKTIVWGMSSAQVATAAEDYYTSLAPITAKRKSRSAYDKPLSSEKILSLLNNRTVEGLTSNFLQYKGTWHSDGTMSAKATAVGSIEIESEDSGHWTISDDRLCRQWRHWSGGRRECLIVTNEGSNLRAYDTHGDEVETLTLLDTP